VAAAARLWRQPHAELLSDFPDEKDVLIEEKSPLVFAASPAWPPLEPCFELALSLLEQAD
jgi:hypothetical protein